MHGIEEIEVMTEWALDESANWVASEPLFGSADESHARLMLVTERDPDIEDAPGLLRDAVLLVHGVERASASALDGDDPTVFVSVRGGDVLEVARAIVRVLPEGRIATAGTSSVEVDGRTVWICHSR